MTTPTSWIYMYQAYRKIVIYVNTTWALQPFSFLLNLFFSWYYTLFDLLGFNPQCQAFLGGAGGARNYGRSRGEGEFAQSDSNTALYQMFSLTVSKSTKLVVHKVTQLRPGCFYSQVNPPFPIILSPWCNILKFANLHFQVILLFHRLFFHILKFVSL